MDVDSGSRACPKQPCACKLGTEPCKIQRNVTQMMCNILSARNLAGNEAMQEADSDDDAISIASSADIISIASSEH